LYLLVSPLPRYRPPTHNSAHGIDQSVNHAIRNFVILIYQNFQQGMHETTSGFFRSPEVISPPQAFFTTVPQVRDDQHLDHRGTARTTRSQANKALLELSDIVVGMYDKLTETRKVT
jgi:hypothetical protein